jgi:hypothetical protein
MKPTALSPVEARESIDRLLEDRAPLVLTQHARDRMRDRRFTTDDILWVLGRGTVGARPEWDEARSVWKYKVSFRDLDGDPLTIVIAIEDRIVVITGHD